MEVSSFYIEFFAAFNFVILNFALHSIAFSVRNKVTFNIRLAFQDAKRLDIRRRQNKLLK